MTKLRLKIKRQNSEKSTPYWESFDIKVVPGMTVVGALKAIQQRPVTQEGRAVPPVVWDCNCLEEQCGACTMIINGKTAQACSVFVEHLSDPVVLEPLTKFKVVRDLVVDRSVLSELLQKNSVWQDLDAFAPGGVVAMPNPEKAEMALGAASCIFCGACLEACPQYHETSPYVGASVVAQAQKTSLLTSNLLSVKRRQDKLMQAGGVVDCKNAQNCEKVCPKNIPLISVLGRAKRDVMKHFFRKVLG